MSQMKRTDKQTENSDIAKLQIKRLTEKKSRTDNPEVGTGYVKITRESDLATSQETEQANPDMKGASKTSQGIGDAKSDIKRGDGKTSQGTGDAKSDSKVGEDKNCRGTRETNSDMKGKADKNSQGTVDAKSDIKRGDGKNSQGIGEAKSDIKGEEGNNSRETGEAKSDIKGEAGKNSQGIGEAKSDIKGEEGNNSQGTGEAKPDMKGESSSNELTQYTDSYQTTDVLTASVTGIPLKPTAMERSGGQASVCATTEHEAYARSKVVGIKDNEKTKWIKDYEIFGENDDFYLTKEGTFWALLAKRGGCDQARVIKSELDIKYAHFENDGVLTADGKMYDAEIGKKERAKLTQIIDRNSHYYLLRGKRGWYIKSKSTKIMTPLDLKKSDVKDVKFEGNILKADGKIFYIKKSTNGAVHLLPHDSSDEESEEEDKGATGHAGLCICF